MKLKLIAILPVFALLAACGEQAPSSDPSTTNSIEGSENSEAAPAVTDESLKTDDTVN